MDEYFGPIQFGDDNDEVFIGRDLAHTRNYGEEVAGAIDREIRSIIDNSYEEAQAILRNHMDILHKTAQLLIEKEKVTGKEFADLFSKVEDKEENSDDLNENTTV